MNIANKEILITGANRGIGQALLGEALQRGAKKVYAGTRSALQHSWNRSSGAVGRARKQTNVRKKRPLT